MTKIILLKLLSSSVLASDIVFTNKTVTFTNTSGRVYRVVLLKATDYGLIWKDAEAEGMVPYTKLDAGTLRFLGVPPERLDRAADRAAQKAVADAKARAQAQSYAEAYARAQAAADAHRQHKTALLTGAKEEVSAGRYCRCETSSGTMLIQGLPNATKSILIELARRTAQINGTAEWIASAGKELRHREAVAHDVNMANLNNPYAPAYYVKQSDYASIDDARDSLDQMRLDFARYSASTESARRVKLIQADPYGPEATWRYAGDGSAKD